MIRDNKLKSLEDFFTENGVWYNKSVLKLLYDKDLGGFDVVCIDAEAAKLGDVLCRIPKEAILSVKTTAVSSVLDEFKVTGGLGLTIALLFEISQKEKSPWFGYLSSLPERADLPIFWSKTELDCLRNTEIFRYVLSDLESLRDDYYSSVVPIVESYGDLFPPEVFTLENFKKASSLVSSRAFQVDNWHLDAMVPLADIFNHQTRQGKDFGEHLHIESSAVACPYCGECGACEHDESETGSSSGEEGFSLQQSESDADDEDPNTMTMTLVRPLENGKTVFNTYGNHSASSLLMKYAFTDPFPNKNDVCTFSYSLIAETLKAGFKVPTKQISQRAQFWVQHRVSWMGVFLRDQDIDIDELDSEITSRDLQSLFFRANKDGSFDLEILAFIWLVTTSAPAFNKMLSFEVDAAMALFCHVLKSLEKGRDSFLKTVRRYKVSFICFPQLLQKLLATFDAIVRARIGSYPQTLQQDRKDLCSLSKISSLSLSQRRRIYALRVTISEKDLLANLLKRIDALKSASAL